MSSTTTTTTSGGANNPFKEEPLRCPIEELVGGKIDTKAKFERWQQSFKKKYENYLGKEGCDAADKAYKTYHKEVVKLTKTFNKLEDYLQQGGEGALSKVGAQKCLADLKASTTVAVDGLVDLLPGSGKGEKIQELGYTNFNMGAVLIEDGFSLYAYLDNCDQILMDYKDNQLRNVDKQILDELENFHKKLQSFCDVMASLGLYDAMIKAREILERDDDDNDANNTVATEPTTCDTSVDGDSTTEKKAAKTPAAAPPLRRKTRRNRVKKPDLPKSLPRNSSRGSLRGGSGHSRSVSPKGRRSLSPINRKSVRASKIGDGMMMDAGSDHSRGGASRKSFGSNHRRSLSPPGQRPSVAAPKVIRELIPIDPNPQGPDADLPNIYSVDKRSDQIWKNKATDAPIQPRPTSTGGGEKTITTTTVTSSTAIPSGEGSSSSLKAALNDSKHGAKSVKSGVKRAKSLNSGTDHSPAMKGPVPPKMNRSVSAQSPPPVRSRSHSPVRSSMRSPSQIVVEAPSKPADLRSSMASLNSSLSSFAGGEEEDEFASSSEAKEEQPNNKKGWTSQAKSFFKVPATTKSPSYRSLKDEPSSEAATVTDPKGAATSSSSKKYVLTITLEETPEGPKPKLVVMGHTEEKEIGDRLDKNVVLNHIVKAMQNPNDYDVSYLMSTGSGN